MRGNAKLFSYWAFLICGSLIFRFAIKMLVKRENFRLMASVSSKDQKPEDDQGGFAFVRNKSFVFQKYIFHHAIGPLLRFSFHCQVPLSARISSVMGNICCWSKDYHRREKSNRHIEVTNVDSEKVRDCHA